MAGAIGDIGRLVATLGLNTAPFMAGMDAANAKMSKAQRAMRTFSKSAMIMGRTMTRFVTLPMLLAGGAAVSTQKKFEYSMTKIIGLVGVSREQVEKWNKEVLKMSQMTGRGPTELADALFFVTSAGLRGAEAMEVLEMSAKASAAGLGETKVVADLVTSAMNAYGRENLSAAEATDILVAAVREGKAEADELAGAMGMVLPIASEFGVTFDQVGAAFAGMTRTGTNARVAATQLKAILSAMASPSIASSKAMASFGVNADDFRKTVEDRGLIAALLDLRAATKGNESAMSEILPNIRALMGTLDLLGENVEYNIRIFEALKNAGGSLQHAFDEIGGTTQQRMNVAMATLQTTFVKLGEIMKPFVAGVLTRLGDRLALSTNRMNALTESQKKAKMTTMILTAAMGPLLLILSKLVQIVMANPMAALAYAIGLVALAVVKWAMAQQTANKVQRQFAKQQQETVQNMMRERIAVEQVFDALGKVEKGTKEWADARDRINNGYGKYLENAITEVTTQEELADALERVSKARQAEIGIKEGGTEITRLNDTYAQAFEKSMKKYTKLISKNRNELWDTVGKTPTDFAAEMHNGLQSVMNEFPDGIDNAEAIAKLSKITDEIYNEYIAQFATWKDNGIATFDEQFFSSMFDAGKIGVQINKSIKVAQEGITKFNGVLAATGLGEEAKLINLGAIDEQIKGVEAVRDALGEEAALMNLIGLYQQKNAYLNVEEQKANEVVISGLKEKLRAVQRVQSSLGEEARLMGVIERLGKERSLLSGKDLKQNARATADAQFKLASLQLELSGLSEVEKMRGRIALAQEKSVYLEGEALIASNKQIANDKATVALIELEASGLNEIEMLRGYIAIAQEKSVYLEGEALKNNKEKIRADQQTLAMEELKAEGAGKLLILQQELSNLQKNADYAKTDAQAKQFANAILLKNAEIATVKADLSNLNEKEKLLVEIGNLQAQGATLVGKEADDNLRSIQKVQQKVRLIDASIGGLTEIEKRDLAIAELEDEMVFANERRRKEIELAIDGLERQKAILQEMPTPEWEMDTTAMAGTPEWVAFYQERIQLAKTAADEGKMSAESLFWFEWDLNEKLKQQKLATIDATLQAAQQMGTALQSLMTARMNAELAAVGDNTKKQEAIKKAYFKKEQQWAMAMAVINIALGVTKALSSKGIVGVIEGLAIAAAGGVEIATIATQKFAKGGIVAGNSKTGDNVPAMLNSGEMVLTTGQQEKLFWLLNQSTKTPVMGMGNTGMPKLSFAEGGLVYGETVARVGEYPGAASNPEVIAPLDKLKGLINPQVAASKMTAPLDKMTAPLSKLKTAINLEVITPLDKLKASINSEVTKPGAAESKMGAPKMSTSLDKLSAPGKPKSQEIPNLFELLRASISPGTLLAPLPKIMGMADGGLAYGETITKIGEYPGVSSNPEVIAPLSDLKGILGSNDGGAVEDVEFKVRGDDLYAVMKRQELLKKTY